MDERDEILVVKLPCTVHEVRSGKWDSEMSREMSGKDKACKKPPPNNQQTINADVDSSQRGAAGRRRGS